MAAEARAFIAELAQRKTIIDPTLVVWEAALTSDGGSAGAGLCLLHGHHVAGA